MILKLIRFYKNEHATDGILTLQGRRLCNTAEHTPCCLKKGKYPIMISTYTLVQPKNFEWPMARNQEEAELIANAEEKAAKSERQEGGEYLPLPAIARKMPCLYPSAECQSSSAECEPPSAECQSSSAECQHPLGCLRFGNGIFTLADASIIVGGTTSLGALHQDQGGLRQALQPHSQMPWHGGESRPCSGRLD